MRDGRLFLRQHRVSREIGHDVVEPQPLFHRPGVVLLKERGQRRLDESPVGIAGGQDTMAEGGR